MGSPAMLRLAGLFVCLLICGCAAAPVVDGVVLVKARLLHRNPESRQPKFECPEGSICLRYPNSFTVDVKEVLIGRNLRRHQSATLWMHTEPFGSDLYLVGKKQPSGELEVWLWTTSKDGICFKEDELKELNIVNEVQALMRAGKIQCSSS